MEFIVYWIVYLKYKKDIFDENINFANGFNFEIPVVLTYQDLCKE